jgi:hypothetical protein
MDTKRPRRAPEGPSRPPALGLGPANFTLLAAGIVSVSLGYFLLSRGSVDAAPLLLVAGYLVLIPAGILVGLRGRRRDPGDEASAGE